MKLLIALLSTLALINCLTGPEYGSYLMLVNPDAQTKMDALAGAEKLPFNRLYIAFVRPDMVYTSNSLESTGLEKHLTFDKLKTFIASMHTKGIEVFMSIGGWDWSCFPYMYMQNSIGAYNPSPNYWKIEKYGNGRLEECVESNNWCYTCEPESEPRTINDFAIFPKPSDAAVNYVKSKKSDANIVGYTPGSTETDPKTGRTFPVPGNGDFVTKGTNPYHDFVTFTSDLGADGIDLDYEEIWYADTHKEGPDTGPWTNNQVIYKFASIVHDLHESIQAVNPSIMFSSAVTVQGADSGKWWGGNMKGQMSKLKAFFPEMLAYFTGDINVMSYDLSSNPKFHECPADQMSNCPLDKQVSYYMLQFELNLPEIKSKVGFEIGQPAYPDITNDPYHQLPLSSAALQQISTYTLPRHPAGGFIWETYKPTSAVGNVDPTTVLNAICMKMYNDASKCNGQVPPVSNMPSRNHFLRVSKTE